MSRTIASGLIAALALVADGAAAQQPSHVAITAIVEHPALDAVRDGIIEGLAELGRVEGTEVTFTYETAQGNPATAAQIARVSYERAIVASLPFYLSHLAVIVIVSLWPQLVLWLPRLWVG